MWNPNSWENLFKDHLTKIKTIGIPAPTPFNWLKINHNFLIDLFKWKTTRTFKEWQEWPSRMMMGKCNTITIWNMDHSPSLQTCSARTMKNSISRLSNATILKLKIATFLTVFNQSILNNQSFFKRENKEFVKKMSQRK